MEKLPEMNENPENLAAGFIEGEKGRLIEEGYPAEILDEIAAAHDNYLIFEQKLRALDPSLTDAEIADSLKIPEEEDLKDKPTDKSNEITVTGTRPITVQDLIQKAGYGKPIEIERLSNKGYLEKDGQFKKRYLLNPTLEKFSERSNLARNGLSEYRKALLENDQVIDELLGPELDPLQEVAVTLPDNQIESGWILEWLNKEKMSVLLSRESKNGIRVKSLPVTDFLKDQLIIVTEKLNSLMSADVLDKEKIELTRIQKEIMIFQVDQLKPKFGAEKNPQTGNL